MLTSRQNLRHRGACGITRACRDRRMPGSIPAFCKFHHVLGRRAGANAHNIHDRMPITEKLSDLLGIEFKQQRNFVIVSVRLGLDIGHIDRTARNRVQYAHQRALRIAIVDMESVHFVLRSAGVSPAVRRAPRPPLILLQTSFLITPPQLAPSETHSPPDECQTPATPARTNSKSDPAHLPFLSTRVILAPLTHSSAAREFCKPSRSPRNPGCRSGPFLRSCADKKAAATVAPCRDICCR